MNLELNIATFDGQVGISAAFPQFGNSFILKDVACSSGLYSTHSDNNLWLLFVCGTMSLESSCRFVDSVSEGISSRAGKMAASF